MKNLFLALALTSLSTSALSAADYLVDTNKSVIKWVGSKVASQHDGTLKLKAGKFRVAKDKVSGNFDIDMTTIKNLDIESAEYNAKLVNHLKSDDFFSVSKFPKATYVILSSKKVKGQTYEITGNLTIKGITKKVSFKADIMENGNQATVKGKAHFDRTHFNIKYNSKSFFDIKKLGDKMIKDKIELTFDIKANKGKAS